MKNWSGLLVAACALALGMYAWTHRAHLPFLTSQPSDQNVSQEPSASDHVSNDSPAGTSTTLLHKTFNVASIMDVPFELPAHASTPQLRGTYQSFFVHGGVKQASERFSDQSADVEFLLLNEQQHADLLNGRPGNALFSADAVSNGEVDFTMPPTFGKPAKYFLIFRNASPSDGKKAVQADFRIDF